MVVFFIVGELRELRFKVLVLVPAILIATVAIVLCGHGLRVIIFPVAGTVALLQVGYIGGCVLGLMLARICFRKRSHAINQRDQGWHIEKVDMTMWFRVLGPR